MSDISRREFLVTTAAGVSVTTTIPMLGSSAAPIEAAPLPIPGTRIRVTVNGRESEALVEDRWTLAEWLRDQLEMTGTKVGCDRGECGSCTVLLDGRPVYSCSYLAVWADGRSVETVEGLATGATLHPLQRAFIEHDAPQCGFCTSGQLMSAKALLAVNPAPTAADVRAALTGNLCRCSNYNHYVEAVVAAGGRPSVPAKKGGAE